MAAACTLTLNLAGTFLHADLARRARALVARFAALTMTLTAHRASGLDLAVQPWWRCMSSSCHIWSAPRAIEPAETDI